MRGVATPGAGHGAPPSGWAAAAGTPTEYGTAGHGSAGGDPYRDPMGPFGEPHRDGPGPAGDPRAGRPFFPDAEQPPAWAARQAGWPATQAPGQAPGAGASGGPGWHSTLAEPASWPRPADPPAQRRPGGQPYRGVEPPSGPEVSGSLTGHILAQGRPDVPESPSDGTRIMIALLVGLGVLVIGGLAVAIFAGDSFTKLLSSFFS